jgi:hypothetical protein
MEGSWAEESAVQAAAVRVRARAAEAGEAVEAGVAVEAAATKAGTATVLPREGMVDD